MGKGWAWKGEEGMQGKDGEGMQGEGWGRERVREREGQG